MMQKVYTELRSLPRILYLLAGLAGLGFIIGTYRMIVGLGPTTNLSDAFPSQQLPARTVVDVIDGPTCLDGYRMWRVSTTLNGQAVTGWVSEGTQQSYFLRQGLPRAVNN
mgnify:CR=1 FL=1